MPFFTFFPPNYCVQNVLTLYKQLHLGLKVYKKVDKAITQVRKPGGYGKVEKQLFFPTWYLNGLSSMLYRFSKNTSRYPNDFFFV